MAAFASRSWRLCSLLLQAALLLLVYGSVAQSNSSSTVTYVVETVFLNSTTCKQNSALPLKFIAGVIDQCLLNPGRISTGGNLFSVRFDCNQKSLFVENDTCSGSSSTQSFTCTPRADLASVTKECIEVPSAKSFTIKYYTSSGCSDNPVQFATGNGVFTSGVVGMCVAGAPQSGGSQMESMITSLVGTTGLVTTVYESVDCTGTIKRSFLSPLDGSCLSVSGSSSIAPYTYYKAQIDGTAEEGFTGQVDLNMDANKLNAQIVGASVGVLCATTALLVLISMAGLI